MNRPNVRFLGGEGKRNRANADLYHAMLCMAWGDCEVIVGHHVNFQFDGDLSTEDEIPSADCLLFDHDIMQAVFGQDALPLMAEIATLRPYEREQRVLSAFQAAYPNHSPITIHDKAV